MQMVWNVKHTLSAALESLKFHDSTGGPARTGRTCEQHDIAINATANASRWRLVDPEVPPTNAPLDDAAHAEGVGEFRDHFVNNDYATLRTFGDVARW